MELRIGDEAVREAALQRNKQHRTDINYYEFLWNGSIRMLNSIWAFMVFTGVVYGVCTGRIHEVSSQILESAGEAVSLCITMAGVMALWVGLMEVAKTSGLIEKMTAGIQPFISFMFPGIPAKHAAREYIAVNLIANILGLGWACTPAGLKAMKALAQLEAERGNRAYLEEDSAEKGMAESGSGRIRAASTEMCTFLILNISSLQLLPVNMIAYRQQYGSRNPSAIIVPAILATLISSLAAVIYCRIREGRKC